MRILAFALTLSALSTAAAASPAPKTCMNPQELAANKALLARYLHVWENGKVDDLSSIMGPGYMGHPRGENRDLAGLRSGIPDFLKRFPGIRFTIVDQMVDCDRIISRATAAATSSATGKPVHMVGVNISRFSHGRIVEEWPVWEVVPDKP